MKSSRLFYFTVVSVFIAGAAKVFFAEHCFSFKKCFGGIFKI